MTRKTLLIAAVLIIAIGAPIAGFVKDVKMFQPETSKDCPPRSFKGPPLPKPAANPSWRRWKAQMNG